MSPLLPSVNGSGSKIKHWPVLERSPVDHSHVPLGAVGKLALLQEKSASPHCCSLIIFPRFCLDLNDLNLSQEVCHPLFFFLIFQQEHKMADNPKKWIKLRWKIKSIYHCVYAACASHWHAPDWTKWQEFPKGRQSPDTATKALFPTLCKLFNLNTAWYDSLRRRVFYQIRF